MTSKLHLTAIAGIYVTAAVQIALPFGTARADTLSPTCQQLDALNHNFYQLSEASILANTGKPISEWQRSDFESLRTSFLTCAAGDPAFHLNEGKHGYQIFSKYELPSILAGLQRFQQNVRAKVAAVKSSEPLRQEFEQLNSKPDNAITRQDVARMQAISEEAVQLGMRYHDPSFDTLHRDAYNAWLIKQKVERDQEYLRQHEKEVAQAKLEEEKTQQNEKQEADSLIAKYGDIGPSEAFLRSDFKTFAGAGVTASVGTVIHFYSHVRPTTSWSQDQGAWILTSVYRDPGESASHTVKFVFQGGGDKGVFLTAAYLDDEAVPQDQLMYVVARIIH
jgi:hypothetical protein